MSRPGNHMRNPMHPLQLPCTSISRDSSSGRLCSLATLFHTMTFTTPVSSSSVMKVTPLALPGCWRTSTRPATRTAAPCAVFCRSAERRKLPFCEALAQKLQRVRAQCEPDGAIVRDHRLPIRGRGEQRPALFFVCRARASRSERQGALRSCHFPEREMTVAARAIRARQRQRALRDRRDRARPARRDPERCRRAASRVPLRCAPRLPSTASSPACRPRRSAGAASAPSSLFAPLERALDTTRLHSHRPHFNAMLARIPHELRGRIEAHRQAVEQRAGERRRLVTLRATPSRTRAARSSRRASCERRSCWRGSCDRLRSAGHRWAAAARFSIETISSQ